MLRTRFALAGCALLAYGMGPAAAGPCTAEIDSVAKQIAGLNTGSTETTGAPSGTTGQHPPTSVMNRAAEGTAASAQDVQGQTAGQPTAAQQAQGAPTSTAPATGDAGAGPTSGAKADTMGTGSERQHPPTSVMNRATGSTAASPQDVQRQTEGQPTAAEQAQGEGSATTRPTGDAGSGPTPGASRDMTAAQAALQLARSLDAQGQEDACMNAITRARQHAGL